MSISITVAGLQELRARIQRIQEGLDDNVNAALDRIGNNLENYVKRTKLSGNPLHVRSGNLRRSITHKRIGSVEIVGTNIKYAGIQEFGGTIRPVRRKWLTIPFPEALTPAGVLRQTAGELKGTGTTFIRKSKKGNLIIFRKSIKGLPPTPLFLLKKETRIPGKHYLRNSLQEQKAQIIAELNNAVIRSMRRG